jgi:ferredoxin, 2Fe-2S
MIHIHFIAADKTVQEIQTNPGTSLMKAAIDAGVRGIEADCGGTLTCATCHVVLAPEWVNKFPAPIQDESDMLDFAAARVVPESRLSCQLKLTADMDGLVVHLPTTQY